MIDIHRDLVKFYSEVQNSSKTKRENEHHMEDIVYVAIDKLMTDAVNIHQAILTLCDGGWAHIAPILLRTMMEYIANCLAIINNEFPEYMAFKYCCHSFFQILKDNAFPEYRRRNAKETIEQWINMLKDKEAKQKAVQYIKSGTPHIFWFKPDENGVSAIIDKYIGGDLMFAYRGLSISTHAGYLGLSLFKDNPDDITIEPIVNLRKTKSTLYMSCRLLLKLLSIRNDYEKLGHDFECNKFHERMLALKNEVQR